ncbi:MAG TPA: hypothetical protein ACFYEM_04855 [Candidatus Hypogeohydataceae bacterium YC40]
MEIENFKLKILRIRCSVGACSNVFNCLQGNQGVKSSAMDDWTLVALEEYKTLRAESLQAIQNQHPALRLGALALGFLLASAFTLLNFNVLLAYLELTLFSPIVIALITTIWASEVGRMTRVGNYISALEKEINGKLKEKEEALYWEQWLRKERKQTRFTYISFIGGFLLLGLLCIGFASVLWYFGYLEKQQFLIALITLIVGIFFISGTIIGLFFWLKSISKSIPETRKIK